MAARKADNFVFSASIFVRPSGDLTWARKDSIVSDTAILLELVKFLKARGVAFGGGAGSMVTGFSNLRSNSNVRMGLRPNGFVLTCRDDAVKEDVLKLVGDYTFSVFGRNEDGDKEEMTYEFMDATPPKPRYLQGLTRNQISRKVVQVKNVPMEQYSAQKLAAIFESRGVYNFGNYPAVRNGTFNVVYEGEGAVRPIPKNLDIGNGIKAYCRYSGQDLEECCRYCKEPGHAMQTCPVLAAKECFLCKKPGHVKKNCPLVRQRQTQREDARVGLVVSESNFPTLGSQGESSGAANRTLGDGFQIPREQAKKQRRKLKKQRKEQKDALASASADEESDSSRPNAKRTASSPVERDDGQKKIHTARESDPEVAQELSESFEVTNVVTEEDLGDGVIDESLLASLDRREEETPVPTTTPTPDIDSPDSETSQHPPSVVYTTPPASTQNG